MGWALHPGLLATATGSQIGQQFAGIVVTVLLTPIYVGALTALYYDLRIRKEGYDIEVMSQALGVASAPDAADLPLA